MSWKLWKLWKVLERHGKSVQFVSERKEVIIMKLLMSSKIVLLHLVALIHMTFIHSACGFLSNIPSQ